MAGTRGHRLFVFWKRRRVVRRKTHKCSRDRGGLSVASYRGRVDNSGTDRKMRQSTRCFEQEWKNANILLRAEMVYFQPALAVLEVSMMEKKIAL